MMRPSGVKVSEGQLSAEELRHARLAAGLTQREAAERVGVTRNTVTRWEAGETVPQGRALERAIEVYGVEIEHRLPDTIGRLVLRRLDSIDANLQELRAEVARLSEPSTEPDT
jgi:transcriptional regulator with XRE-family HTH domain